MKMKQILGIALAGAVSMGAVLGSGMPVYAASEDWIRFDVDSNGNKQPPITTTQWGSDPSDWEVSYGYTIHPNYKYVLRFCNDDTKEWAKNADGSGYYDFQYCGPRKVHVSIYDSTLVDSTVEAYAALAIPHSLEEVERVLLSEDELNKITHFIPEGEALIIRGWGGADEWKDVLATGSIMVYDQNNNLVDTFPLQSQPSDNTAATVPVTEPADTMPAAENTADMPVVTDTTTNIVPVQPSDNSVSVEAVAKEVINGKWGVGKERRAKLEAAGYDYGEVQKKVAAFMK